MMVKPATADSTPDPDGSTLPPSAHLIAYLSTPIVAIKDHRDITVTSDDYAHVPLSSVTGTPLVAAYGVPVMAIAPQTTSSQDQVDQSTTDANNAARNNTYNQFTQLEVLAMGVEYVNLCNVIPRTPPDEFPDFDVALWHEFVLQMAPIHLLAKKAPRCDDSGRLFVALSLSYLSAIFVPILVTIFLIILVVVMNFITLSTTEDLQKTGKETVSELAPKFLSKGYKIVFCCSCKHQVMISRIGLISFIENELDRHIRSQQENAEVTEDGNTIPPPVMGVELMNVAEINPERPLDNLPDLDIRLWHDYALQMAHNRSRVMLGVNCYVAIIYVLALGEGLLLCVLLFLDSQFLGSLFFGVVFIVTALTGILWLHEMIKKGYRATFKEFAPKFHSQGYNLVYIPDMHIILISSVDLSM